MDNLIQSCQQNNHSVSWLKNELKKLGAKTSGNKDTLVQRWNENSLNRILYQQSNDRHESADINIINETLLSTELKPLLEINKDVFEFLTVTLITSWFWKYHAMASLDRGLRLAKHSFICKINCKIDEHKITIAGTCFAEKPKHRLYTVKLLFLEEQVNSANCECVAGAGLAAACKPIGAIMFGLQHYGSTAKSLERVSPTSLLQVWHQSGRIKKHVSKTKISDFNKPRDLIKYSEMYKAKNKTSDLQNLFINQQVMRLRNLDTEIFKNV